jgi:hypothetical protein
MPHVEIDREWTAEGAPPEVAARVSKGLQAAGIAVVSRPGALPLEFTGGSGCLTRLIGGWFVGLGTLPKKGTVSIEASDSGSVVRVHVEDTLGFALVDPAFRKRFEQSLEEVVAAARKATT